MTISSLILAAKAIARVIEHKAPGTCTSILKDLDKVSIHPFVVRQRVDSLKHHWEKYHDLFTSSETAELSTTVGFEVADPSTWDSFFDFSEVAATTADVVDTVSTASEIASTATDVADAADAAESAGGLLSILADLF